MSQYRQAPRRGGGKVRDGYDAGIRRNMRLLLKRLTNLRLLI
jgi:hypothetical protein